jgi:hypothetical protein
MAYDAAGRLLSEDYSPLRFGGALDLIHFGLAN